MRVAPDARVDDGLFDWVIVPGMSRLALLRMLPLLYRGTHLDDPQILRGRGRVIEARGRAGAVRVDVDGESPGALPVSIDVLPGAVQLIGPRA